MGLVAQISTSHGHSCAVKLDNTVECWGSNSRGKINVPEGLTAKQVVTGTQRTCAVKLDDTVICWGSNHYGETDIPEGSTAKML